MKATLKQLLTEEERQSIFYNKSIENLTVRELHHIGLTLMTTEKRAMVTENTSVPAFAIIVLTARAKDKNLNILEP